MKKNKILISAMMLWALQTHATQWSVSNSAFIPGQFNSITAAIASSLVLNGDTLLIHPTAIQYAGVITSKSLTYIGGGFNPQKVSPQITYVSSFGFASVAAANNSRFYGLKITGFNVGGGSVGTVSNILLEECHIENPISVASTITATNFVIRNCVISSSFSNSINLNQSLGSASTVYVSNSILIGGISNSYGSLIVRNCTFLTPAFGNIQNATFENCIFRTNAITGITNSVFNYCISGVSSLPTASNAGTGNLASAAVVFINVPSNSINFTYDYHLAPASPGYTGGNDGQQLGIYGGNSTFSHYGEPLNSAIIRSFTISNTVIPVNGTLNINATITRPNNQ